jgi:hypothetical protein
MDSVDLNRIHVLSEQFNNHRSTHPVLSKIWNESLEIYKNQLIALKKTIEHGEKLIEKLSSDDNDIIDPNMTTILTILSILTGLNHNDVDNNDRV